MKLSNMKLTKKLFASFMALALALTMCAGISTFAFADNEEEANAETEAMVEAVEETDEAAAIELNAEATGDCTATIKYYEYADYEDPQNPIDEDGRIFIADYVINGLHEGDVLDAWDYVFDIPGHFFFDGWPAKLTISKDSSKNVIELMYFKKWEYEYTVNYYLMVGADLTANNWKDALAPQEVEFIKMGSETFTDQRINKLVKGDAYAYKLDGMYCIDTYPTELRVGLDADNNVINVLYTPDSVNLPDNVEIPDENRNYDDEAATLPDDVEVSDDPENYDNYVSTLPDDLLIPEEELAEDMENAAESDGESGDQGDETDGSEPNLPEDSTMNKDEFEDLLPDNIKNPTDEAGQEANKDFLGDGPASEQITITDEMAQNPVSKEEAQAVAAAYRAGYEGSLAHMGDSMGPWLYVALGAGGLAALILIGLGIRTFLNRRKAKSGQ